MRKTRTHPRLQQIEQFIVERRHVSTTDLCETFGVSEATIRRSLEQLASTGSIQRIHGGAVAMHQAPPEPPVLQRAQWQQAEKQRIGAMTAQLIEVGDTVFISSGTTGLAVAQALQQRTDITVVSNSLPVLHCLADSALQVIGLGGMLRHSESSFIGHLAIQGLSELRINKIVFGIRGIDIIDGLTNDYLPETMTDRAILSAGQQVIVVADHTKLGRTAPAFVAPLSAIDVLVTDTSADATICQSMQALGIHVLQA